MGNCCLPTGQMLISVSKNGEEHEQLVCSRCHRHNHSRSECYAGTYSDGSTIKQSYTKYETYYYTPETYNWETD